MKFILKYFVLLFPGIIFGGPIHPPQPLRGAPPPGVPIDQYQTALFIIAIGLILVFKNNILKFKKAKKGL